MPDLCWFPSALSATDGLVGCEYTGSPGYGVQGLYPPRRHPTNLDDNGHWMPNTLFITSPNAMTIPDIGKDHSQSKYAQMVVLRPRISRCPPMVCGGDLLSSICTQKNPLPTRILTLSCGTNFRKRTSSWNRDRLWGGCLAIWRKPWLICGGI